MRNCERGRERLASEGLGSDACVMRVYKADESLHDSVDPYCSLSDD